MIPRLVRWKAVVPLAVFLALIVGGWWLLADPLGRRAVIAIGSRMTGAEVDLAAFHIHLLRGSIELDGLQLADASDLTRNTVEADRILFDLDPAALFEKKFVVDQMAATGVRLSVIRTTPARPIPTAAADTTSALASARAFAARVSVPLLKLTPVDSLKALVVDPSQLKSVAAAAALQARGDSVRKALQTGYDSLRLQPVVDSSQALADRMAKFDVRSAGVAGAQKAAQDLNRGLDQIRQAEARVAALQKAAAAGSAALNDGAAALEAARQQDYALARGLLKLPTLSPADISAALFGRMATDRFARAVYWVQLARKYMPAGMLPKKDPGPKRLRRAGTTVRFPALHQLPTFLVRQADLSLSFGGSTGADNAFRVTGRGITSDPALYGGPTTFGGGGRMAGTVPLDLEIEGLLDHTGAVATDSAAGRMTGVKLPSFALPGLPYSAAPGAGTGSFAFALHGDQLRGRWTIETSQLSWTGDTAGKPLTATDQLVGRVLRGIGTLKLDATLGGTLAAPTVSISSNVGDAVAQGVSALAGEAVKKAEAQARAAVDQQAGSKIAAAKAQVAGVQATAAKQSADAGAKLEGQRKLLESRLQSISRGVLPGGIKF